MLQVSGVPRQKEGFPISLPHLQEGSQAIEAEKRKEAYRLLIDQSVSLIAEHQNQETGLFPAATRERFVAQDHYNDAWIRDSAFVVSGLLDAYPVLNSPEFARTRQEVADIARSSLEKNLDLLGREPWTSAFRQNIGRGVCNGQEYTHLTQAPPPIHLRTNGESCSWPTQNQLDSWGELLIAVGSANQMGILPIQKDHMQTVKDIMRYVVRCKPEKFETSSMWEDPVVKTPVSLSTALIAAKGLEAVLPVIKEDSELAERVERSIWNTEEFIQRQFPIDYTVPNGHYSKADLATLVALSCEPDKLCPSLSRYFLLANRELGNGEYPGKIRFRGDKYYRDCGGEAVWFMGLPLEAAISFREAAKYPSSREHSEVFRKKGFKKLETAIEIGQECGYYPELFMQKGGGVLVPNGNELLWNHSLMVKALALGSSLIDSKPELLGRASIV